MTEPAGLTGAVRVRSVPAGHPYVAAAIVGPLGDDALVLPDPVLDPADPARWWPHPALDPAWLRAHARECEVLHVHFGVEHRSPAELAELTRTCRELGLRLVVTVHDLHNPHEADPAAHLERLGVLVRAADAVLTLTAPAAREIRARWGVPAVVVPHPPLGGAGASAPRTPRAVPRVGVHLKELRANTDAPTALLALEQVVRGGDATHVEVRIHRAVLDPDHPRHDASVAARLDALEALPGMSVLRHHRLDDDALAAALARLDVVVLPYAFGTHSGWLELCRGLGVRAAVPDCGHYAAQVEPDAVAVFRTGDPDSLTAALTELCARARRRPLPPTTSAEAAARSALSCQAHLAAYRAAPGDGR